MRLRSTLKLSFTALILLFFMPGLQGCSQVQLASHYTKKIAGFGPPSSNAPRSVGRYKVGRPYKIKGRWYTPKESFRHSETGIASWYGPGFHGKQTANGETYNQYELTAAHRTLQMPSLVRVTNLDNGKSLVVRINDRGPFAHGRIIDMSKRGAELLGFKNKGTARVRVTVLEEESRILAAAAKAGQDTSLLRLASLKKEADQRRAQKTSRRSQPQHVAKAAPTNKRVYKPEPAVLVNDARSDLALPSKVPLSVRPKVIEIDSADLLVDTGTLVSTPTPRPTAPESDEMAFLQQLDFMKKSNVKGHSQGGHFLPDQVVEQVPVTETRLYIQAGAFGSRTNADRLAGRIGHLGPVQVSPEANSQGKMLYHVRVGPMADVDAADIALAKIIDKGLPDARIIVD